jgi:AcrR family transcriptional regulator
MSPRRVDRDAKREEVLAAAVRVFARKGFAATRIEDVAAEAGVGKGTVYLYFDSRDALLGAAFTALTAASEAVLAQARNGPGAPLDRLRAMVETVLATTTAQPELGRIMLDMWSVGRNGEGLPLDMAALYQEYRSVLAGLLREAAATGAVRPDAGDAEATVLVGAIEGCLLQWVVDPRLPVADLARPILAVCLDGLLIREHA